MLLAKGLGATPVKSSADLRSSIVRRTSTAFRSFGGFRAAERSTSGEAEAVASASASVAEAKAAAEAEAAAVVEAEAGRRTVVVVIASVVVV